MAYDIYTQKLALSRKYKDKKGIAIAYSNIGSTLYKLDKNFEAIEMFQKALELSEKHLSKDNQAELLIDNNKDLFAIGNYRKAEEIIKKALH